MSNVLYNFQLIPETELLLPISNRAFQYNDGVFETMLYRNGNIRFLTDHLHRLQRAARVLQLELPKALFQPDTVASWVEKLITENKLTGMVRLKLKIWRIGKGLYTPEVNKAEVLITAEPQKESKPLINSAAFAESVWTHYTPYSFFKGPNSLQYVLAGIEKKQRNLEEIILLSSEGFVSECLASNIFWVKNDMVYTPKTEIGCVAGIMRENLLRLFQAENIPFQDGNFLPENLMQAEAVFSTNAAGIKVIQEIGETAFSKELPAWLSKLLAANFTN